MNAHYWRMLTTRPTSDSRLAWFPDAWSTRISTRSTSARGGDGPPGVDPARPVGQPLYIRFPARSTRARSMRRRGDPGSGSLISEAASVLGKGYRGLYVDDVNLTPLTRERRKRPARRARDPRAGQAMTEADWRRYMAESAKRSAPPFPTAEIVHTPSGTSVTKDPTCSARSPRGPDRTWNGAVNDPGIRGGTGDLRLRYVPSHIDRVHAQGRA